MWNRMSIFSQNTMDFCSVITGVEQKFKYEEDSIDLDNSSKKLPKAERKKIVYTCKTPDKEFEYQNMKVNELYHLVKQQDKSKLGALQLIPNFEVMYEPPIRVDWSRTISTDFKPEKRISNSENRSKLSYNTNSMADTRLFDKTQTYRVPTFDISKMKDRDNDNRFRNTIYCAEFYNPNKEATMLKMNSGVPKFERQSKRSIVNSIYRHKRDKSPEIYNYQGLLKAYDKLGHIKSKVPAPDFTRQSSIEKTEEIKNKRKIMSLYSILTQTAKAMVD